MGLKIFADPHFKKLIFCQPTFCTFGFARHTSPNLTKPKEQNFPTAQGDRFN
ncbi:hypothetical protein ADIS_0279 [Lunatimonas lonarensis]|uniref:Uncharacterized protein n=1 Tax=Lunatimonas lonarensis TaxID=1232681 RepID=R7ZYZ0_9BACT|nr:hypothetical protein ADIS_0279 [Lunatimonas lonarensis]